MDRPVTAPLIELAESQHGVVTRAQLLGLGIGAGAIDSRLRRDALRPLHRGVYALGHAALADEGRWLAAVLAAAPDAVLSHFSAALLWRMRVPWRAHDAVHVTTTRGQRGDARVVVHRTRRLEPIDVVVVRGVPVTTVARTVLDCADLMTYPELRTLADHGVRLDVTAIEEARTRAPGRRGAPRVRRLIASDVRTRSKLERAMKRLCREANLPRPLVNDEVLGYECDFVWRPQRLIVEADGGGFHAPKPAREADYERASALAVAGWRVVRFTYDQVVHEPAMVAARLGLLLTPPAQGVR
jgi:very-short-patch-repair endonuclease